MTERRDWRAPDPVAERGAVRRVGDPLPLAGPLDRLLERLGAPGADALTAVFERWDDLVGEPLCTHGRPVSVDGGVLVVEVAEPGWATEWRYRQGEVLRRLDERLGAGAVARVEVRVRPR